MLTTQNNNIAAIVLGGNPPSLELMQNIVSISKIIIAADSGADCLYNYGIKPDLIIGDLDSISDLSLEFFKNQHVTFITYPKNKDYTDAKLACDYAVKNKIDEIIFLGFAGGNRIDHIFGIFGLLQNCLEQNVKASLKDDCSTITLINKAIKISGKKDELFSLQAYSNVVENLNISGAKYSIKNHNLTLGSSLTLSNQFLDNTVCINFSSGQLLLFRFFI